MPFVNNALSVASLWPFLPQCKKPDFRQLPNRQKVLLPLVFLMQGQEVQFEPVEINVSDRLPSYRASVSLDRDGGYMHVDGHWLDELCQTVGLSGLGGTEWSDITGNQQEFLLRWLLGGLLQKLQMLLKCEFQFGTDCSSNDNAEHYRFALFHHGFAETARKARVWLDLSRDFAMRLPCELMDPQDAFWMRIPFILSLQAGYQNLRLDQLKSLACGDIVLLCKPLEKLHLVLSSFQQSDVSLDEKGYVITNSWYFDERREVTVESINVKRDTDNDAIFDDLTVQLVCEVGRISMTLVELKSLSPGTVLPMNRSELQAVDLIVNGAKIGQGELVRLDDALGVRVVRVSKLHG